MTDEENWTQPDEPVPENVPPPKKPEAAKPDAVPRGTRGIIKLGLYKYSPGPQAPEQSSEPEEESFEPPPRSAADALKDYARVMQRKRRVELYRRRHGLPQGPWPQSPDFGDDAQQQQQGGGNAKGELGEKVDETNALLNRITELLREQNNLIQRLTEKPQHAQWGP